jgi:putative hydrolase of the HAD superfamily
MPCPTRPDVPTCAVRAVIFDWGGTLTPFHDIDLLDLWRAAAEVLAPDRVDEVSQALARAEAQWWQQAVASGRSGTTADVLAAAAEATGFDVDAALHDRALAAHLEAWTPHTIADPQAAPLLTALRERGIRTGLLSNTHWPRAWHERWLARDGLLELLDARTYTSDLAHLKPHPEAFRAAMEATAADGEPLRPEQVVFVGDRPLDDISGAQAFGMRTVLLPGSLRASTVNPDNAVPDHPVEPDLRAAGLGDVLTAVDAWRRS